MKYSRNIRKIDLHMHTTVSDGTDSPLQIVEKVKEAGIDLFAVTDHDAIAGADVVKANRRDDDPLFLPGVEFSCKDEFGKYHILGYAYDPSARAINDMVKSGHSMRLVKMEKRLKVLKDRFGFNFSDDDVSNLFLNSNPGKPHLANLMVKYGFAADKDQAFSAYLNRLNVKSSFIRPEAAITAILESGGIPVLAHPPYGSGNELIRGTELEDRLKRLITFGLRGAEGFYSTFTPQMHSEILELAEKYDLYVTAGSDYHGKNKPIRLGENQLSDVEQAPRGLHRFLEEVVLR